MERHLVADVLRHVVEILAVPLGEDHVGQPRGVRGEHLLLQPADREHAPLQRHLAGHPDRVLDRAPREERRERGRHRDPGARPVLRDRARRHVDVERPLERVLVDAQPVRPGAQRGERDLRRLLHHVAELAGEDELLAALRRGCLDEEDVAARARSRQARSRRPARPSAPPPRGRTAAARARHAPRRARARPAPRPSPEAIRVAVLRSSFPSSRSSCRTPASRVYSEIDRLEHVVARSRPRPRAARSARAGAARGSRGRSRPSRRSCSRRSGSPPSGRAAAPGSCPPRSPSR